jgi:hypothetical protein
VLLLRVTQEFVELANIPRCVPLRVHSRRHVLMIATRCDSFHRKRPRQNSTWIVPGSASAHPERCHRQRKRTTRADNSPPSDAVTVRWISDQCHARQLQLEPDAVGKGADSRGQARRYRDW